MDDINLILEQKLKKQMSEISKVDEKRKESFQEEDLKVAKEMFFQEDRETGRISFKVFLNILNKLGGWGWFLGIYIITQCFPLVNAICNNIMLEWSKDFSNYDNNIHNMTVLIIAFMGRNIFTFSRALVCA